MLIYCIESYYYATFKFFLFGGNLEAGVEAGVASNSDTDFICTKRHSKDSKDHYREAWRCQWTP